MADDSGTNETAPVAPKISFGIKTNKTSVLKPQFKPAPIKSREYIKSINDGDIEATVKKEKEEARVIPLPTSSKNYRQRLTTATAIKAEIKVETELPSDISHLSIEKRAELEILRDLQKKDDDESLNPNFVIPKVEEAEMTGAKEATMDDYENVPIVGFGLAMLRGMGLKEEDEKKPNDDQKLGLSDEFKFRPKGMGLGADQTVKPKELKIKPKAGQILQMKKGAFVVILGGNYKDFYGEVRGFDENNGRVIVKLALGQKPIMLGEKFVQLVTPEEYQKYSKIPVETEHEKKHNGKYGLIASSKNDTKKEEEKERRRSRTPEERYKSSSRHEKSEKYSKESSSRHEKYKSDKYSDSRDSSRYEKSSKNGSSRHRYSSESESDSDDRHRKSSKSKKKSSHKHKSHDRNRERYYSSDEDRRDRRKSKKEKRGRSRSRSR
ncbi:G-patch domain and KOW motifs-containing protein-like [Culicoides brevitarsis]|uniref:G-patch domain and KOW motifs-containing protein-like n=1 Tax=Culicoides brevitarsis TaxID=469753 RepID=UPI00307B1B97